MIAKLILVALLSASVQALPLEKGCAVESRAYQLLHEAGCWTRLVRIEYGGMEEGHAVCVYALANNDLWVYDCNFGSRKLDTKSRDIAEITRALGEHFERIRSSKFMDEQ